jgi:cobalt-zinc-cadmium efflux system membrane fusion protein
MDKAVPSVATEPLVISIPPSGHSAQVDTPAEAAITEPAAAPSRLRTLRSVAGLVFVLLILVLFLAFIAGVPLPGLASTHIEQTVPAPPPLGVQLVEGMEHTLMVPEEVRTALGIRKDNKEHVEIVKVPTTTRPLVLSGSTTLDPTRVMRIRARFAPAEVAELGQKLDPDRRTKTGETEFRELRSGDWVKKGDRLGVFYSEVVGQKKNDLIDALVQLKLDEEILERAQTASHALPEVALLTYRRNVETDRNAAYRALNTLKIWGIPKADIDAVYKEADEIHKRKGKRDASKESQWARVELKAPDDGVIVERNVSLREIVQDPTVNLFQIAKVDRLTVLANAPEDDLPTLLGLPPSLKRWTVRPLAEQRGDTAAEGESSPIDDISYIIDNNQHNAVVKGHIDNPAGKDGLPILRGGQFVSCTIQLSPPRNVVEVPITAIVDDGRQCVVFVQPDPNKPQFTLRRVKVVQRFEKTAFVRTKLTAQEQELTPEEKEMELLPPRPLGKGERVLTTGVLELKKELEDRESKAAEQAGH